MIHGRGQDSIRSNWWAGMPVLLQNCQKAITERLQLQVILELATEAHNHTFSLARGRLRAGPVVENQRRPA